ncbi:GPW/gp25 family protein [Edaphobacter sp. HDX4]|uniref:GPW/gp25 family protein n=1 Tax=Edaphobacter sp. HDX4 TaxID=2794064 RepID=UPI002FE608A5
MNPDFPLHFDDRGRTSCATEEDHVRQMIELLLFTRPGERVNRPDFGSGLMQLVFAPNSPELAATVQFTMQAAIQGYLGDLVDLQSLEVISEDSLIHIELSYVLRRTGQLNSAQFSRQV